MSVPAPAKQVAPKKALELEMMTGCSSNKSSVVKKGRGGRLATAHTPITTKARLGLPLLCSCLKRNGPL